MEFSGRNEVILEFSGVDSFSELRYCFCVRVFLGEGKEFMSIWCKGMVKNGFLRF